MSLQPPHLPSPAYTPDTHPQAGGQGVPGHVSLEDERKRIRDQVESRLNSLSQDLYELEICAGAVVKGQEDRIPNYMKRINEQFIKLHELSREMQPAPETGIVGDSVPKQVVENVDGFRNPHTYTKNALSRATGENQYALGRILGLESFRRQLHDAIGKEMPGVPLPPRQHQPTHTNKTNQEANQQRDTGTDQINGTMNGQESGNETQTQVKTEQAPNGSS